MSTPTATAADVKSPNKKAIISNSRKREDGDYKTTAHEFRALVRWLPITAFPEGQTTSFVYFQSDRAVGIPLIQSLGIGRSRGLWFYEVLPTASSDVIRSTLAKASEHASNTAVLINPLWSNSTIDGRDVNTVLKDVLTHGPNVRTLILFSKPLDERVQTETERLIKLFANIKSHRRESRRLQSLWMDFFFLVR